MDVCGIPRGKHSIHMVVGRNPNGYGYFWGYFKGFQGAFSMFTTGCRKGFDPPPYLTKVMVISQKPREAAERRRSSLEDVLGRPQVGQSLVEDVTPLGRQLFSLPPVNK